MLKNIEAKPPSAYRIDVGGAVEEGDTANRALMAVFPVMVVTILTILTLQVQSFSRMFMVFRTAPLGSWASSPRCSFSSAARLRRVLGATALCGMIMRNTGDPGRQVQAENRRRDRMARRVTLQTVNYRFATQSTSGSDPEPSFDSSQSGHSEPRKRPSATVSWQQYCQGPRLLRHGDGRLGDPDLSARRAEKPSLARPLLALDLKVYAVGIVGISSSALRS